MFPTLASARTIAASCAPVEPAPADDDASLVARALAGDRVAEAQIYRRHARALANVAARLTGSRADAEDIVQETFVIALEHLRDLRDPSSLRAWLTRVAVTRAQRRLRRRKVLRWLGLDRTEADLPLDAMASHDASPEVRAELSRVAAALDRCEPEGRVAWTLHRVEAETLEATAEACGCSLATVKRRIAAVEAALARDLSPRGEPR